jgi:hypothetical protein
MNNEASSDPGVGKLTTAKALCEITGATLVDNHLINNPVLTIVRANGVIRTPDEVRIRIGAIRDIIFDTILNVAPKTASFILTNFLNEDPSNQRIFNQVRCLAHDRGSEYVPVTLTCVEEEIDRRVVSADRAVNMKMVNPAKLQQLMRSRKLLPIDHPNLLELDNTHLPPEQAALAVCRHIDHL